MSGIRSIAAASMLALAGCVGAPPAADLMLARDQRIASIQERRFEGVALEAVQPAVVTVLQDLGFQVSASDAALGLIVATRGYQKTAGEYGREFAQDVMQVMQNFFTLQWHREPDPARVVGPPGFNAAVSIAPAGAGSSVRVSFHRFVRRPTGEPIFVWAEELPGPEPYQRFFTLLSQTLARENKIRGQSPNSSFAN